MLPYCMHLINHSLPTLKVTIPAFSNLSKVRTTGQTGNWRLFIDDQMGGIMTQRNNK